MGTSVLLEIIADYPGAPRNAALNILLDWWGCFLPEPGFESFTDQHGETIELILAIVQRVTQAAETLHTIVEQDTNARGPARELLKLMTGGWTIGE
jgi:hypothetical protein